MEVRFDRTFGEFFRHAGDLLETRETENHLLLGLGRMYRQGTSRLEPVLARAVDETGATRSAAILVPNQNLVLSFSSSEKMEEIEELGRAFRARGAEIPGVVGPAAEAERFAALWSRLTYRPARLAVRQLIHRLSEVIPPPAAPGLMRKAIPSDLPLLAQWMRDFSEESLPQERKSLESFRYQAEKRIQAQEIRVWVPRESLAEPLAMAAVAGPTRHGIRVNGVYTPPSSRGRGFATSLVAGLSQEMLNQGKRYCFLYTDQANPISNGIYRKIGYQPVCESRHYVF